MACETQVGEVCAECGEPAIPIVYGYSGAKRMASARQGEIVLGGCVFGANSPKRRCTNCYVKWSRPNWPGESGTTDT
jgi:hypothetical protein